MLLRILESMRKNTTIRMDTVTNMEITTSTTISMEITISMDHLMAHHMVILMILITLHMDLLTALLMDPVTNTVLPSGSVQKKQKTSSYLSQTTIPSERKSSHCVRSYTDAKGMLGSTRPHLTLLDLDSIILLLYRSNRNGRGLWDYLPLDLMRISMRLVLLNLSRGCMTVWASWEFGSIPYVPFLCLTYN
jgi:hypothetical protein